MAAVLTIPHPSFAPIATSSIYTISNRPTSIKLPHFKGLKIHSTKSITSNSRSTPLRRGARIACEAQDTAIEVAPVTDATWQSLVLECDTTVLVEFWAPWCGPCRMIHPVIDELAQQYAGKLKCYKVNTDESPSIATRYGIRSIPTVIIFKSGEKKDAIIGAVPKSTLTTCIEKFV